MPKMIVSIFLTMKATILGTHGSCVFVKLKSRYKEYYRSYSMN